MAKAHIRTKAGTKITIEGEPQEVAAILRQVQSKEASPGPSRGKAKEARRTMRQKVTPINLISSLIDGGFFRKPKDLAAVKLAIEEMGHHYPVTSLSPALLRLVRRRQLRRIKDKKRWLYTG